MPKTDSKKPQTPSCEVVGTRAAALDESVDVRVEFCEPGNYRAVALDLARAIVDEFRVDARPGEGPCCVRVRLIPARDGRFEVYVEGRLIFSKRATYRLPDADEIFYHVAVARAALEQRLCAV